MVDLAPTIAQSGVYILGALGSNSLRRVRCVVMKTEMSSRVCCDKMLLLLLVASVSAGHTVEKRGIPVSSSHYTPDLSELTNANRVAEWSASSAVNSAVGRDYSNQLATTAQFVAQFTAPVTKDQAGRVFDTISESQKAARVGQALALSSGPVHRAASNAARTNYDQAFQTHQLGYHRGRGGGRHSGY